MIVSKKRSLYVSNSNRLRKRGASDAFSFFSGSAFDREGIVAVGILGVLLPQQRRTGERGCRGDLTLAETQLHRIPVSGDWFYVFFRFSRAPC